MKLTKRLGSILRIVVVALCSLALLTPVSAHAAGSFSDVGPRTPHYDDILWLAAQKISTGFPDGTFKPYGNVARCDMAAFLYRLAGQPSYEPTAKDKAYFSDVNDRTPHAKEIWWLASKGVSRGWDEKNGTHTFRPYVSVARCDMAAFLYRLAGSPNYTPSAKEKAYFSDINASSPHANEVWWLASVGVSAGWTERNGSHTFRPFLKVARCDMAAFLHRLAASGLAGAAGQGNDTNTTPGSNGSSSSSSPNASHESDTPSSGGTGQGNQGSQAKPSSGQGNSGASGSSASDSSGVGGGASSGADGNQEHVHDWTYIKSDPAYFAWLHPGTDERKMLLFRTWDDAECVSSVTGSNWGGAYSFAEYRCSCGAVRHTVVTNVENETDLNHLCSFDPVFIQCFDRESGDGRFSFTLPTHRCPNCGIIYDYADESYGFAWVTGKGPGSEYEFINQVLSGSRTTYRVDKVKAIMIKEVEDYTDESTHKYTIMTGWDNGSPVWEEIGWERFKAYLQDYSDMCGW